MKQSGRGLLGALVAGIMNSVQNSIQKKIRELISDTIAPTYRGEWGVSYPVIGAYKVKRGKKKVSYQVDMEYETKRGNTKNRTLKINVAPGRVRKQMDKNEFKAQLPGILDTLEQTMNAY